MSEQPMNTPRQEALAAFDHAYAAFLAAFKEVPDEALSFLPEGDEYTLGVLLLHLQDPLRNYMALLDQMLQTNFAQIDQSKDAEYAAAQARRHAELVRQRPGPAERPAMLAELYAIHQQARARLAALDDNTFERPAPVIYAAGTAPYPTSARDIAGWLIDHYREHTTQTQAMLAQWQTQRQA
jgi:hypothetical protein